jgi:hypothetical protein
VWPSWSRKPSSMIRNMMLSTATFDGAHTRMCGLASRNVSKRLGRLVVVALRHLINGGEGGGGSQGVSLPTFLSFFLLG